MNVTYPKDFLYVRLALNVGNIREVFTYRRIKDRSNRINVGPKEEQLPHFLHNLYREKIGEIQRKQRRSLQTFVWHAYLPCFADDFWNVFCLFDFGRYQFFKLWSVKSSAIATSIERTSDIFTDCESACDKDSFVLPRFELKCVGQSEMKRLTYSWSLFEVLLHRCKFCSSVKFFCNCLVGRTLPTVVGVVVIQILHFDIFRCYKFWWAYGDANISW